MIKGFTTYTNWINVAKTISDKYIARLELENSKLFEFSTHPVAKSNNHVVAKDGKITEITYQGTCFKNDKSSATLHVFLN